MAVNDKTTAVPMARPTTTATPTGTTIPDVRAQTGLDQAIARYQGATTPAATTPTSTESTSIVAQPESTTAADLSATTPTTSTSSLATGNSTIDDYNAGREQRLRETFDAGKQSAIAALQTAYDRSRVELEAARDKIPGMFQERGNEVASEYERQRRNNNIQAAATGINTGAGSQMQLAQSNAYQSAQAGLRESENEALIDADQGLVNLKMDFENKVAEAIANNDYELAKMLFDEYGDQYQRIMTQAQHLAEFGDFSLFKMLYGEQEAANMERSWMLENPDLAWTLGKITKEDYFKMTGKWPHESGGGGGGGSGGGRGYSGYGSVPQGYYSSGTVANIQRQIGASADGIAGPETLARLQAANTNGQYDQYISKWYNL